MSLADIFLDPSTNVSAEIVDQTKFLGWEQCVVMDTFLGSPVGAIFGGVVDKQVANWGEIQVPPEFQNPGVAGPGPESWTGSVSLAPTSVSWFVESAETIFSLGSIAVSGGFALFSCTEMQDATKQ